MALGPPLRHAPTAAPPPPPFAASRAREPRAVTRYAPHVDASRRTLEQRRRMTMAQRRQFWLDCASQQYTRVGRDPRVMRQSCRAVLDGPHPSDSWNDMIDKDVPRTGVLRTRSPGREALRNILRAFSRLRPAIGYCQALSMVGAWLLSTYNHDEDTALGLLLCVVDVLLPDYFSDDMRGLVGDLEAIHILMHDRLPALYEHLRQLADADGSPPLINAYVSAWLASLFIHVLPASKIYLLWDCLFADGGEVLSRCALAVFVLLEPDLLSVKSPVEYYTMIQMIVKQMNSQQEPLFPGHTVLETAYSLGPFPMPCYNYLRAKRSASVTHTIHDLGVLKSEVEARLRSSSQDAAVDPASGAHGLADDWSDLQLPQSNSPPELYIPDDAESEDAVWELVNAEEASEADHGLDVQAHAAEERLYRWFVTESKLPEPQREPWLRRLCCQLPLDVLQACLQRFGRWDVAQADPQEQNQLMLDIMRSERVQFVFRQQREHCEPPAGHRPGSITKRILENMGRQLQRPITLA